MPPPSVSQPLPPEAAANRICQSQLSGSGKLTANVVVSPGSAQREPFSGAFISVYFLLLHRKFRWLFQFCQQNQFLIGFLLAVSYSQDSAFLCWHDLLLCSLDPIQSLLKPKGTFPFTAVVSVVYFRSYLPYPTHLTLFSWVFSDGVAPGGMVQLAAFLGPNRALLFLGYLLPLGQVEVLQTGHRHPHLAGMGWEAYWGQDPRKASTVETLQLFLRMCSVVFQTRFVPGWQAAQSWWGWYWHLQLGHISSWEGRKEESLTGKITKNFNAGKADCPQSHLCQKGKKKERKGRAAFFFPLQKEEIFSP